MAFQFRRELTKSAEMKRKQSLSTLRHRGSPGYRCLPTVSWTLSESSWLRPSMLSQMVPLISYHLIFPLTSTLPSKVHRLWLPCLRRAQQRAILKLVIVARLFLLVWQVRPLGGTVTVGTDHSGCPALSCARGDPACLVPVFGTHDEHRDVFR